MQILMYEETKHVPDGPYVPKFYELAYSNKEKTMMMRSELLDGTFDSLIRTSTIQENDRLVPAVLVKIARILQFLQQRLAFDHRDLKGDNIMYALHNGTIQLKLIDFGLSCMTWKGLSIRGEGYSGLKSCFKQDRDLSQFIYSIARYESKCISKQLYTTFANILHVNLDPNHVCEVLDDCVRNGLTNWASSYNFFNRTNVHIPRAEPESVVAVMQNYLRGKPFRQTRSNTMKKPCGPGKMRNPQTRRCHTVPIPISASKPKQCPEGKLLNTTTNRCIKDPALHYNPVVRMQ
jgi:serine/threonine protein kinase